ncbi:DUF3179 domain-containing protein [Natrinema sp. 1APR25-10V2]|uniref:DUF3179 domain-containing protein n=1 Tax=Natrinema sp. 1APR25-10V2 TaxID=2951081 RepID=UPI002874D4C3|nr:DUF3179 domain-containing protein [Natrinema sp. 1APR25-10V2]MDS0475520.1 DUF3179 domain-containing protein [Natrinema sp. 1APR25-10V2]
MRDGRRNTLSRRRTIGAAGSVAFAVLAGCLDGSGASDREATSMSGPPLADRSLPEEYTTDELEDASLSGGPGQDDIPSIDDPQFSSADDPPANLAAGDPVFGVELNGNAKAYPQYVLVWHEVVNDVVGGESVAVTYCPLTGTAQGFYRGESEFGVSGRLVNSNLVMYDRGTETWWPQMLARGIRGPNEGEYLEEFQVTWTTWKRWSDRHPDTAVLTEDTGHIRNYGDDPYGGYNPRSGYYEDENTLFSPLATDDRFPAKQVVVGARNADGSVAVPKTTLRERSVVDGSVGGVPHVTVYDRDLDAGHVYRNPDDRTVEYDGDAVTVDGTAHEPTALPLEREIGFDAMWFAWYGYYPSTEVHA